MNQTSSSVNANSQKNPGSDNQFDVDWVVIGSGFGGSVSAMRLAEKGYSVLVIERGEHFRNEEEMPKNNWDARKYFYAPKFGLRGLFRQTIFKDVFVFSGAGVGGGSLVYAMTLYVPPKEFFEDRQWAGMADWQTELAPHYETAQRMLGVTDVTADDFADQMLKTYAEEIGVEDTYRKARVGTYLENPGQKVSDPYFGGEGPDRMGCSGIGRCMLGCPQGSKNSTDKNYLYFAQKYGTKIITRRNVVAISPLSDDGSDGWMIRHEECGASKRKADPQFIKARGVVLAGGTLGTNELLMNSRHKGLLPRVSHRLGHLVRTNSEAVLAVTVPEDRAEGLSKRVAITSSIYPDPRTHIETVTYGPSGSALRVLFTVLTGNGTKVTRPLRWAGQMLRHPKWVNELLFKKNWDRRTIIVLVMQTLDNAMRLVPEVKRDGSIKMQTQQDPHNPNPTFIPEANAFTDWLARATGGAPGSSLVESLFSIPSTAHFLGGAPIGPDENHGVIDSDHQVYGYKNLLVCDGSAIPANVGVNPSLTITALSERAMSKVPVSENGVVNQVPLGSVPIEGATAVESLQAMPGAGSSH